MTTCIACRIDNHEMCRVGKEDCSCECQDKPKEREFTQEQLRIMEESVEEERE